MKAYLRTYNMIQLTSWSSLLLRCLLSNPSSFYTDQSIEIHLKLAQTLMFFEVFSNQIIHAAVGISPSPLVPTTMQIFSRLWAVYGVMDLVKGSFWVFSACLMWSVAECIRYGNYLYSDLVGNNQIVTWIRYSGFVVLYPLGISSELLCLLDAMPVIEKCCPRVFSLEMPNSYNFSFDYLYFIWISVLPGYVFGSPYLYNYMLGQRKRKLQKAKTS